MMYLKILLELKNRWKIIFWVTILQFYFGRHLFNKNYDNSIKIVEEDI